jgi:uracil-DNA glycosylase
MSRPDALFAELGLAPLWVRREAGAQAEIPDSDVAVRKVPARSAAADRAPSESTDSPAQRTARSTFDDGRYRSDEVESTTTLAEEGTPLPASQQAPFDAVERVAPETSPERGHLSELKDDGYPAESSAFEPIEAAAPAGLDDVSTQIPVAKLDFAALRERVAGCTACGLCAKRTQTVFGVGDEEADWMIVGEAPGENEDRLGEPFVGQAGKLLDNMLHAVGLERTQNVYIANVIKCRPPGNRNPQPDEVARCEPYLKRQVELVRPKMILALGRFAAQTLLKSEASISSLRGRVHQYEGVPVIVSYHPAYLLRSLPEKGKAWADLCLAQATYRKAAG